MTAAPPAPNPKTNLSIQQNANESNEQGIARVFTSPEMRSALTLLRIGTGVDGVETFDPTSVLNALLKKSEAANAGDLKQAEATLISQASVLDGLFHMLARRSMANMGEYIGSAETYMRLALKAQTQCRATIETLGLLKNPAPVAFVRQANISNGPQQVNNGVPVDMAARAKEIENQPSKLLEANGGERLDFGKTATASRANQDMATVGKINGAKISRRKAAGEQECLSRGRAANSADAR